MKAKPDRELIDLIGEEGLAQLAEAFGGIRLYVPQHPPADHEIVQAIGPSSARKLADRYGPDYLKVPLARELRAARYRAAGASNAQVARKLGITEGGVERLFARLAASA